MANHYYNLFSFEKKTKFVKILKALKVISLKDQHVSGLTYKVNNTYKFNLWNPVTYFICIPVIILIYLLIILDALYNAFKNIASDMYKIRWVLDEYYRDKEYAKEYIEKRKKEKK